jgi:hypothetical protein
MQRFEYRVIPAPRRGEKSRAARTTEDRFALAMTNLMNQMGADGWDYVRADVLPCDERVGLTGSKTTFQNMLVFRRVIEAEVAMTAPRGTLTAEPPVPFLRGDRDLPETAPLRLGTAEAPVGAAPPVGPVKPELAAE